MPGCKAGQGRQARARAGRASGAARRYSGATLQRVSVAQRRGGPLPAAATHAAPRTHFLPHSPATAQDAQLALLLAQAALALAGVSPSISRPPAPSSPTFHVSTASWYVYRTATTRVPSVLFTPLLGPLSDMK